MLKSREKAIVTFDSIKVGMVLAEPVKAVGISGEDMVLLHVDTVLTNKNILKLKHYHVENITIYANEDKSEDKTDRPPIFLRHKQVYTIKGLQKKETPRYKTLLDEELHSESIDSIQNLFTTVEKELSEDNSNTSAYQVFNDIGDVVNKLIEIISNKPHELIHISDLKSYDEYTYHHSLSVAVLSLAIGQTLKMNNWQLKGLGLCAIMHDIGKIKIPHKIIMKPSKLTSEEFAIVKLHPELGYEYMRRQNIGNRELLEGVLHHHEKFDGSGYPKMLKGREIPLYSRIISVADVYDALTSNRPYREPLNPPSKAIEYIMSEVGRSFDYDIVIALVRRCELYPVNTFVTLSDGRNGVVVKNTNPMRPVIKLIESGDLLDLLDIENLNLVIEDSWYE